MPVRTPGPKLLVCWIFHAASLVIASSIFATDATRFDIPAGSAEVMVQDLADQYDLQLIYPANILQGIRTQPVVGELTPVEALRCMLEASNLEVYQDPSSGALLLRNREPDSALESNNQITPDMKIKQNSTIQPQERIKNAIIGIAGLFVASTTAAQIANPSEEEIFELSPFEVETSVDSGYMSTSTLAGTRLRTELSDIGTAISVLNSEFLEDIGATDTQTALAYATNTEVVGSRGNYLGVSGSGSWGNLDETGIFLSPSSQTRVRGLVSADNTRNYFRTTVGWDSYNVSRIDLLRGPNSILFGLGSPGGVMNATTQMANLNKDSGELQFVFDEHGTLRADLSYNKVLIKDQLAAYVSLLSDDTRFQQNPAFDEDQRAYLAIKYKPEGFLNRKSSSFELTLDYEKGDQVSNRPRSTPPVDSVTPFFQPNVIKEIQLPAGSNYNGYDNGVIPSMEYYLPDYRLSYEGNYGGTLPAGLGASFDGNGPRLNINTYETGGDFWRPGRISSYGVLNNDGSIYTGNPNNSSRLFYSGYLDRVSDGITSFARNSGHPFGFAFNRLHLTDPGIFDFYNKLIDGPNKREWGNSDQLRLTLSNTFLHNRLGYELSYYTEKNDIGQTTFLSDSHRIFLDINQYDVEGNPNPDVGRAYLQETTYGGNRVRYYDLSALRASVFFDYDFRVTDAANSWWRNLLGRHVFNAVYTTDTIEQERRDLQRHVLGDDWLAQFGWTGNRYNNNTRVAMRYYISDDLTGTDISDAHFSNMDRYVIPEGGAFNLRYFDTEWNATGVNPAASWVAPTGRSLTEAANPANYVGWTNGTFQIIDALSGTQDDLDLATRTAILEKNTVDSKILSYQGYLFDGALIGTFGWRRDKSDSWRYDAPSRPDRGDDVNPETFSLNGVEPLAIDVESKNYSAVLHLNRLPLGQSLPLKVSFTYNKGENFNPSAGRLDYYGNPISPPQGSTEEYGILLATNDNKYVFRVMSYETSILNATGPGIAQNFTFQQFIGANPGSGYQSIVTGLLRGEYEARAEQPDWSIDDQENIHAPAWLAYEQELLATFPDFIDSALTYGTFAPTNEDSQVSISWATNTQDTVSEGLEFEFTANPTPALRLTINASRTEAMRDNVPGETLTRIYEFIQDKMYDGTTPTAVGLMRSGNDPFGRTMADFWTESVWSNYSVVKQLNGQFNSELVEWRLNLVANYSFLDGPLDGFGIGGAYRYEGEATVGYPRYFDEFGNVAADIDNPFKRPSNDTVDLWIRYNQKLMNGKVDWSVQLHLYNALGDNELIPININPDCTTAQFRIKQGTMWRISNTFRF